VGMPRTAQHLPQGQVDLPYMAGLTPDEDRELRRLHALAEFGALTEQMSALYDDLRERDRRSTVREPRDVAVPYPRSDEPEDALPGGIGRGGTPVDDGASR